MDRIRVLLVEDHTLLRETLRDRLSREPDLEVAAEAANADEALRLSRAVNPDVILLDLTLPDQSGIAVLPELRKQCPDSRVLVITVHNEPSYLRAAIASGASGYLVKTANASVLLDAIRATRRGEVFIDPSMRAHLSDIAKPLKMVEVAPISRLSDREREVLVGLAQGLKYQEIAAKMGVSVKTVETYRTRLTTKLGFKNRADLMRFAIESGILHQPPQAPS